MNTYGGTTSPPVNNEEWLERLKQDFPDWVIWRSNTGCWYGTHRTPYTPAQEHAGLFRVLDADTPDELNQKLTNQEQRAEQSA